MLDSKRGRFFLSVLCVFAVGCLIVLSFFFHKAQRLEQGALRGYSLNGTYRCASLSEGKIKQDGIFQIAIQEGDGIIWLTPGLDSKSKELTFKKTFDPNIYILIDASGEDVGWMHLAYALEPDEGYAFVSYFGEQAMLEKVSAIPVAQV